MNQGSLHEALHPSDMLRILPLTLSLSAAVSPASSLEKKLTPAAISQWWKCRATLTRLTWPLPECTVSLVKWPWPPSGNKQRAAQLRQRFHAAF